MEKSSVQFPELLYSILELADGQGKGCSPAITWLPHGYAFKILDEREFMEVTVPIYFRQTKILSFYRQLNMWGFRRVLYGTDAGAYYNEFFLRGCPDKLRKMVRVKVKGNNVTRSNAAWEDPDFYRIPPLPSVTRSSNAEGQLRSVATCKSMNEFSKSTTNLAHKPTSRRASLPSSVSIFSMGAPVQPNPSHQNNANLQWQGIMTSKRFSLPSAVEPISFIYHQSHGKQGSAEVNQSIIPSNCGFRYVSPRSSPEATNHSSSGFVSLAPSCSSLSERTTKQPFYDNFRSFNVPSASSKQSCYGSFKSFNVPPSTFCLDSNGQRRSTDNELELPKCGFYTDLNDLLKRLRAETAGLFLPSKQAKSKSTNDLEKKAGSQSLADMEPIRLGNQDIFCKLTSETSGLSPFDEPAKIKSIDVPAKKQAKTKTLTDDVEPPRLGDKDVLKTAETLDHIPFCMPVGFNSIDQLEEQQVNSKSSTDDLVPLSLDSEGTLNDDFAKYIGKVIGGA